MARVSSMVISHLPKDLVEKLDQFAHAARRSRSWVIRSALEHYLENQPSNMPDGLMRYAGAGVALSKRRTTEEVDAEIRWLRGDD